MRPFNNWPEPYFGGALDGILNVDAFVKSHKAGGKAKSSPLLA